MIENILMVFGGWNGSSMTNSIEYTFINTTIPPTNLPTLIPTNVPTLIPTSSPSLLPSIVPSNIPTLLPSNIPTNTPSNIPSNIPTTLPTFYYNYSSINDISFTFSNNNNVQMLYYYFNYNYNFIIHVQNNESLNISSSFISNQFNLLYYNLFSLNFSNFQSALTNIYIINYISTIKNVLNYYKMSKNNFNLNVTYLNDTTNTTNTTEQEEQQQRRQLIYNDVNDTSYSISIIKNMSSLINIETLDDYIDYFNEATNISYFIDNVNNDIIEYLNNYFTLTITSNLQINLQVNLNRISVSSVNLNNRLHWWNNVFYLILIITIIIVAIITYFSCLHTKGSLLKCNNCGLVLIDDVKYLNFVNYCLQVIDLICDISFSYHVINLYQIQISPVIIHKIIMIMSILFILLPYIINLILSIKIMLDLIKINKNAKLWFEKYNFIYLSCLMLSGNYYSTLLLISSKLFGLDIFNCGINLFELVNYSYWKIITHILLENIPVFI